MSDAADDLPDMVWGYLEGPKFLKSDFFCGHDVSKEARAVMKRMAHNGQIITYQDALLYVKGAHVSRILSERQKENE